MKTTRAKSPKTSKVAAKEKTPFFPVKASKPAKGKPRSLGRGTYQTPGHEPRVV